MNRYSSVWWWLALGSVLIGVGLRVGQWWWGGSLFIDELAVVHNLTSRSWLELVSEPLSEAQVAPPLFLWTEKAVLLTLGDSEHALRLVPLLFSLASLPLLWSLARRVLTPPLIPLALLTLACGFTFVYYSAQVKQYASDVTLTLLILRLALALRATQPPGRGWWLGTALVGLVAPFYSQVTLLVLAGSGGALVLLAWLDAGRPRWWATVAVVGTWAAGCLLALLLARSLLAPVTQAYMHFFWRDGLLELSGRLPLAFLQRLAERWVVGLGWPQPGGIWALLTVAGAVVLCWQRRAVALVLLAPWVLAVLASVLHEFPLQQRLMDFLLPSMLLFLLTAVQAAAQWLHPRARRLSRVLPVLLVAPVIYGTTRGHMMPFCFEDTRVLYEQVARLQQPNDHVYAYYAAGQSLRWYAPQVGLALAPDHFRLGECHRLQADWRRQYLAELDTFRGQSRVWVIMVHYNQAEQAAVTAYLDSIGRRGPQVWVPSRMPEEQQIPSFARLYDLSDRQRAARFQAATFPLPAAAAATPAERCWSCYGPQVLDAQPCVTAPSHTAL